jgi:hypothetical protein
VATIPKLSTKALSVFLQRYYEEEEEERLTKGAILWNGWEGIKN